MTTRSPLFCSRAEPRASTGARASTQASASDPGLVRARASRSRTVVSLAAALLGGVLLSREASARAQDAGAAPAPTSARTVLPAPAPGSTSAAGGAPAAAALKPEQLEAMVAPLALYPDPLLSQVLVASTYPLEIIEAQQWVGKNPTLKGDALLEAAKKQPWDPSVQSMVGFPDVIKRMSENIRWTTDLGNAFLAQQSDVLDAVQRLRVKAKDAGKLVTTEQQTVTTKVVEKETIRRSYGGRLPSTTLIRRSTIRRPLRPEPCWSASAWA
jgi:hypothetical protein